MQRETISDSPEKQKDIALQLIRFSSTGFSICEEGLSFIRSLRAPISVLGIAGPYRSGKSFFLNRVFLGRPDGFEVSRTIKPHTSGIWVWGRPISYTSVEGESCQLLLLDSEGLDKFDTSSDSRAFALVALLSSVLIYNTYDMRLTQFASMKDFLYHIKDPSLPALGLLFRDCNENFKDLDGNELPAEDYFEYFKQETIVGFLKEHFSDKTIYKLPRPLRDSRDIRTLPSQDLESLDLRFVEDCSSIRTALLDKAKAKTINGRLLSGEMLCDMIASFIESLNMGRPASISQAWTFISKNECAKSLKQSEKIYDGAMSRVKMPINAMELRGAHREAKEEATSHFIQKSLGEGKDNTLKQLFEDLAEKYSVLKSQNEEEMCMQASAFLRENYGIVETRLRKGEFNNFLEYEREMKNFYKFFVEHGPDGPQKKEIILEFLQSKVTATADFFITNLKNDLQLEKDLHNDKVEEIKAEVNKVQKEFTTAKDLWEQQLSSTRGEKGLEQALREQLELLRSEKEKSEKELREKLRQERVNSNSEFEKAYLQVAESEAKLREAERSLFQTEADHAQEKELTETKLKFLETALEESRKREKALTEDLNAQRKDQATNSRSIANKYESQIKTLQARIDVETERASELEKEFELREATIEKEKQERSAEDTRIKTLLEESKSQVAALQRNAQNKELLLSQRVKELSSQAETSSSQLKSQTVQLQDMLKTKEAELSGHKLKAQKENAVLEQKLEFLTQQVEDLKSQLETERSQHANMFKTLQADLPKEDNEAQIQALKQKFIEDLRALELNAQETASQAASANAELQQRCGDLEVQLRVATADHSQKTEALQLSLNSALEEKQRLADEFGAFKLQSAQNNTENEARLQQKLRDLQAYNDELAAKHDEEVRELGNRADSTYQQLKDFYEQEKQRLERKIAEDKERADKRYASANEEFEDRLRQEAEAFEDELAAKEDELRDLEALYSDELTQTKHQLSLAQQKVESLEKFINELKSQAEAQSSAHLQALQLQQERFNVERNTLAEKLEKAASDAAAKDRELSSAQNALTTAQREAAGKVADLEALQQSFSKERDNLSSRCSKAQEAYQNISDELTAKQSDFKRELALAQQELEFKTKRIVELERNAQESEEKHSETVKLIKDEASQELSGALLRLNKEKEDLETKLEQRRKAAKESQSAGLKQATALEKERAVLAEKLVHLETKKTEVENRLLTEIEQLQAQVKELGANDNSDKISLQLENERLKTLLQELEKELNEKNSSTERERVLWENKFNFLIQQRDQARMDQTEAQKKFDATLEQLQRRGNSDKEKLEQATTSLISSIENRYTSQIKDLNETHAAVIEDLSVKNKHIEKELRTLREQLETERRGRAFDGDSLVKKVSELKESEKRLISETDLMKKEKEAKLEEIKETLEHEIAVLKRKMTDYEQRARQAEAQRAQLFLEHEKERAKWGLEREHLITAKCEAIESLEKSERKKESLMKENEQLKGKKFKREITPRNDEHTKRTFEGFYSTNASPRIRSRDVSPLSIRAKNRAGLPPRDPNQT